MNINSVLWAHLHQVQGEDDVQASVDHWLDLAEGKFTGVAFEFVNYRGHSGNSALFEICPQRINGLTPLAYICHQAAERELEVWLQWEIGWIQGAHNRLIDAALRAKVFNDWNMKTHGIATCSGDGSNWFRLYMPEVRDFHLNVIDDLLTHNDHLLPYISGIMADGIRYKWQHKDCPDIAADTDADTKPYIQGLRALVPDSVQVGACGSHNKVANENQGRRCSWWLNEGLIDWLFLMGTDSPASERHPWILDYINEDKQEFVVAGIGTENKDDADTIADINGWLALDWQSFYAFSYPRISQAERDAFPDIPEKPEPPEGKRAFQVDLNLSGTITEL